jgi:hypothetical protein
MRCMSLKIGVTIPEHLAGDQVTSFAKSIED